MSGATELRILVNPQGHGRGQLVVVLARCLGARWTEAMYRWYLKPFFRLFRGQSPDRVILIDGERVVATVVLAYRLPVRTPDGTCKPVLRRGRGLTLPGAPGADVTRRVLQAAVDRSALRACTAGARIRHGRQPTAAYLHGGGHGDCGESASSRRRSSRGFPATSRLRLAARMPRDGWPGSRGARRLNPPYTGAFTFH